MSAQEVFHFFSNRPDTFVSVSSSVQPPVLKGLRIGQHDPFRLDFILDPGTRSSSGSPSETPSFSQVREKISPAERQRLIRYFLGSLTIPEGDLWVNLSPYEKDRIIPQAFGLTEMGRDLLQQDYLLKQLTASLLFPEAEAGKKFWDKVYEASFTKFGTTDIPIDTFNKVWIVPEKAVVFENPSSQAVYVVESRLKVMVERDYTLRKSHVAEESGSNLLNRSEGSEIAKQVLKEVVIPILEKEINEGTHFSMLRQIYHSLILAAWYKKRVRESLLNALYVDKNKIAGVHIDDPNEAEKIWNQYLVAFKRGVFNFVKEEREQFSGEMIPRKYFSGGMDLAMTSRLEFLRSLPEVIKDKGGQSFERIKVRLDKFTPRFYTGKNDKNILVNLARPYSFGKMFIEMIRREENYVKAADTHALQKSYDRLKSAVIRYSVLLADHSDIQTGIRAYLHTLEKDLQFRLIIHEIKSLLSQKQDDILDSALVLPGLDRLLEIIQGDQLIAHLASDRRSAVDALASDLKKLREAILSGNLAGWRRDMAAGHLARALQLADHLLSDAYWTEKRVGLFGYTLLFSSDLGISFVSSPNELADFFKFATSDNQIQEILKNLDEKISRQMNSHHRRQSWRRSVLVGVLASVISVGIWQKDLVSGWWSEVEDRWSTNQNASISELVNPQKEAEPANFDQNESQSRVKEEESHKFAQAMGDFMKPSDKMPEASKVSEIIRKINHEISELSVQEENISVIHQEVIKDGIKKLENANQESREVRQGLETLTQQLSQQPMKQMPEPPKLDSVSWNMVKTYGDSPRKMVEEPSLTDSEYQGPEMGSYYIERGEVGSTRWEASINVSTVYLMFQVYKVINFDKESWLPLPARWMKKALEDRKSSVFLNLPSVKMHKSGRYIAFLPLPVDNKELYVVQGIESEKATKAVVLYDASTRRWIADFGTTDPGNIRYFVRPALNNELPSLPATQYVNAEGNPLTEEDVPRLAKKFFPPEIADYLLRARNWPSKNRRELINKIMAETILTYNALATSPLHGDCQHMTRLYLLLHWLLDEDAEMLNVTSGLRAAESSFYFFNNSRHAFVMNDSSLQLIEPTNFGKSGANIDVLADENMKKNMYEQEAAHLKKLAEKSYQIILAKLEMADKEQEFSGKQEEINQERDRLRRKIEIVQREIFNIGADFYQTLMDENKAVLQNFLNNLSSNPDDIRKIVNTISLFKPNFIPEGKSGEKERLMATFMRYAMLLEELQKLSLVHETGLQKDIETAQFNLYQVSNQWHEPIKGKPFIRETPQGPEVTRWIINAQGDIIDSITHETLFAGRTLQGKVLDIYPDFALILTPNRERQIVVKNKNNIIKYIDAESLEVVKTLKLLGASVVDEQKAIRLSGNLFDVAFKQDGHTLYEIYTTSHNPSTDSMEEKAFNKINTKPNFVEFHKAKVVRYHNFSDSGIHFPLYFTFAGKLYYWNHGQDFGIDHEAVKDVSGMIRSPFRQPDGSTILWLRRTGGGMSMVLLNKEQEVVIWDSFSADVKLVQDASFSKAYVAVLEQPNKELSLLVRPPRAGEHFYRVGLSKKFKIFEIPTGAIGYQWENADGTWHNTFLDTVTCERIFTDNDQKCKVYQGQGLEYPAFLNPSGKAWFLHNKEGGFTYSEEAKPIVQAIRAKHPKLTLIDLKVAGYIVDNPVVFANFNTKAFFYYVKQLTDGTIVLEEKPLPGTSWGAFATEITNFQARDNDWMAVAEPRFLPDVSKSGMSKDQIAKAGGHSIIKSQQLSNEYLTAAAAGPLAEKYGLNRIQAIQIQGPFFADEPYDPKYITAYMDSAGWHFDGPIASELGLPNLVADFVIIKKATNGEIIVRVGDETLVYNGGPLFRNAMAARYFPRTLQGALLPGRGFEQEKLGAVGEYLRTHQYTKVADVFMSLVMEETNYIDRDQFRTFLNENGPELAKAIALDLKESRLYSLTTAFFDLCRRLDFTRPLSDDPNFLDSNHGNDLDKRLRQNDIAEILKAVSKISTGEERKGLMERLIAIGLKVDPGFWDNVPVNFSRLEEDAYQGICKLYEIIIQLDPSYKSEYEHFRLLNNFSKFMPIKDVKAKGNAYKFKILRDIHTAIGDRYPFDQEWISSQRNSWRWQAVNFIRTLTPDVKLWTEEEREKYRQWQWVNEEINKIREIEIIRGGASSEDFYTSLYNECKKDALFLAIFSYLAGFVFTIIHEKLRKNRELHKIHLTFNKLIERNSNLSDKEKRFLLGVLGPAMRPHHPLTKAEQNAIMKVRVDNGISALAKITFYTVLALAIDIPQRDNKNVFEWARFFPILRTLAPAVRKEMMRKKWNKKILTVFKKHSSVVTAADVDNFIDDMIDMIRRKRVATTQRAGVGNGVLNSVDAFEQTVVKFWQNLDVPAMDPGYGALIMNSYLDSGELRRKYKLDNIPGFHEEPSLPPALPEKNACLVIDFNTLFSGSSPMGWIKELIKALKASEGKIVTIVALMPDGRITYVGNINSPTKDRLLNDMNQPSIRALSLGVGAGVLWDKSSDVEYFDNILNILRSLYQSAQDKWRNTNVIVPGFYTEPQEQGNYASRSELGLNSIQTSSNQTKSLAEIVSRDRGYSWGIYVGVDDKLKRIIMPVIPMYHLTDKGLTPAPYIPQKNAEGEIVLVDKNDQAQFSDEAKISVVDGGIDLNSVQQTIDIDTGKSALIFQIDPSLLKKYSSATGFVPVIFDVEQEYSLFAFLGTTEKAE